MLNTISEGAAVSFPLHITFLKLGLARINLDEERRQTGDIELRHGSKARKERYNECQKKKGSANQKLHMRQPINQMTALD